MLIGSTPHYQIWRFYAHNTLRNYSYVITHPATGGALIIDPWDGEKLYQWVIDQRLRPVGVLNTHGHHDHLHGNPDLIKHGVPVLTSHSWLTSIPVPGHTMEHVAFLLKDGERHLFVGDTVFQSGVGNCRHGGNVDILFDTISTLKMSVDAETWLQTGHDYWKRNLEFALSVEPHNLEAQSKLKELSVTEGYDLKPTQWKDELKLNPFLRLNSPEIRDNVGARAQDGRSIFVNLRQRRDQW